MLSAVMASMARLRVHAAGSVRGHLRQMSAHVGKKQVGANWLRSASVALLTAGSAGVVLADSNVHLKMSNVSGNWVFTTPSGLQFKEMEEGVGEQPKKGDTVQVHYVGTLLSTGEQFDSSYDRGVPLEFAVGVGRVIQGWDEGIMMMKEGSKRLLIIPPNLAYGTNGVGRIIPPNATLVFVVHLVKVTPKPPNIFKQIFG